MHHGEFSLIVIQLCAALLLLTAARHYTRHSPLPGEVWVLLAGIGYGIAGRLSGSEFLPRLDLSPDVVLFVLLPLLIFASGRLINPDALRTEALPIGLYAVAGVVATTFLVGVPVAYILDIGLLHGLLFGAAIAATDPVAVGAIFHRFHLPEKLELMVEGESLFNDGTTVVLFQLLASLAIAGAAFDALDTGVTFLWAVLGAFPLGWVLGWISSQILRVWHEHHPFFPVTMTMVLALLSFVVAEHFLHLSGVIAVLVAAMTFVQYHRQNRAQLQDPQKHQDDARIFDSFWEYIAIVANGFLFFALGAETGAHPYGLTLGSALLTVVVLMASRSVVIYLGGGMLAAVGRRLPWSWLAILNLGGLRGAVSAALILTIAHDYPHREIFLCLAFTLITASLIIQPLAMHFYLKQTKLAVA